MAVPMIILMMMILIWQAWAGLSLFLNYADNFEGIGMEFLNNSFHSIEIEVDGNIDIDSNIYISSEIVLVIVKTMAIMQVMTIMVKMMMPMRVVVNLLTLK